MYMSISLLFLFQIFLKELAILTALNHSPPPFCPKPTMVTLIPTIPSKLLLQRSLMIHPQVALFIVNSQSSCFLSYQHNLTPLTSLSFLKQNFHLTFKSLCYSNFLIPLWLFLCYLPVPFLLFHL